MYQERSWEFFPVGDCFRKQYEGQLGWLEIWAGWRFNYLECVTVLILTSRYVFRRWHLCVFNLIRLPLKDASLLHFLRHIFCLCFCFCSTRNCFWGPADWMLLKTVSVEWAMWSISDFSVNTPFFHLSGFLRCFSLIVLISPVLSVLPLSPLPSALPPAGVLLLRSKYWHGARWNVGERCWGGTGSLWGVLAASVAGRCLPDGSSHPLMSSSHADVKRI